MLSKFFFNDTGSRFLKKILSVLAYSLLAAVVIYAGWQWMGVNIVWVVAAGSAAIWIAKRFPIVTRCWESVFSSPILQYYHIQEQINRLNALYFGVEMKHENIAKKMDQVDKMMCANDLIFKRIDHVIEYIEHAYERIDRAHHKIARTYKVVEKMHQKNESLNFDITKQIANSKNKCDVLSTLNSEQMDSSKAIDQCCYQFSQRVRVLHQRELKQACVSLQLGELLSELDDRVVPIEVALTKDGYSSIKERAEKHLVRIKPMIRSVPVSTSPIVNMNLAPHLSRWMCFWARLRQAVGLSHGVRHYPVRVL